ncbi:MAG: hypothetical protein QG665_425 [Patescibacteria group bacterium]|nr:hypothetical protein [Patescibacteria group bacterium]
MKKIIIIVGFIFILLPSLTLAGERGKNILFTVNPNTPGPLESTTISIRSFVINLVASEITWYLDGVEYAKGFNLTKIDFATENWGDPTEVKAQAKLISGKTLTEAITIFPTKVDLLWHTNSYTPVFYTGKKLASAGNTITVSAEATLVSEKGLVDPSALIYEWQKNGENLLTNSGIGKKVLTYKSSGADDKIKVKVSTQNGQIVSEAETIIPKVTPFINLYEIKPLTGVIWSKTIQNKNKITGGDITISAEPYYFNTTNTVDNLSFEWKINDKPITSREDAKKMVTLINDSLIGEQLIGLGVAIKNTNLLLQKADRQVELYSSYYNIGF